MSKNLLNKKYELIIVGAGIAGITAAIYASRKRIKFLLFTEKKGGQFYESGEILNYPGIKKTTGIEFSRILEEQLKFNNIPITEEKVLEIKKRKREFVVKTNIQEVLTKTIILATGSHPHRLNVPGEKEFQYKGVTYCAICDGPLYAGKEVVVIGGGNSALEAAESLIKIAKKVSIINNSNKFKAHEYLIENIKSNSNIKIINSAETLEILGEKNVTGIKYKSENKVKILNARGIFIEIGRVPNTSLVKKLLKLDNHQHIIINCDTSTSVPGIFAAGDCSSIHEYQYIIAAGQGCTALLKAAKYLSKIKKKA